MPAYEDILNGSLQKESADSYTELLARTGNTDPAQDPPFYITAYGLAVRAGFRGTLAEWLLSLIGPKGDDAELRYDAESQTLQWKQSDESEWKTLLTLADLQGDVVAQTLAAAEEATKHAPRISATNHWEIWNAQLGVYEDTGIEAMAGAEAAQEAAKSANDSAKTAADQATSAESYAKNASSAASKAQSYSATAASSSNTAKTAAAAAQTAKEGAETAQAAAEQAAVRQPILSENNTWMIWDAELGAYVDTGVSAIGKDGGAGQRGSSILRVTTAPEMQYSADSSYFGFLLENVISESGAAEVLVGDMILHENTLYRVSSIMDSILLIGSMDSIEGTAGQRGTGILKVTTAPSTNTTEIQIRNPDGSVSWFKPSYRILVSTVKSQSGVSEVLEGDIILYSYYQYKVVYVTSSYAYMNTQVSIRGAAGSDGEDGADGITPHIGANGNWFIGEEDTGISAIGGGTGGEAGENGTTFTPNVDADGNLSWSNDGGLDNPETVNIKGSKGDTGRRGNSILQISTSPYAVSDAVYGNHYRIGLAIVLAESGAEEVYTGDTLQCGSYQYTVQRFSSTSVILAIDRIDLRGPAGANGYTPQKGTDYYTDADKEEMVEAVLAALPDAEEESF